MSEEVTLKDFNVRYANLRRDYPDNPDCSVEGCHNPVDVTEGMGIDTSCAYHRLLFDYWTCEAIEDTFSFKTRAESRKVFKDWLEKTGKETCDKLVLEMAKEPINWDC